MVQNNMSELTGGRTPRGGDGGGSRLTATDGTPFQQMFVESVVRIALERHGYDTVKRPGEEAWDVLYYGPLGWRKLFGKQPLVVGIVDTTTADMRTGARVLTFGDPSGLTKIIGRCALENGFRATYAPGSVPRFLYTPAS